MWSVAENSIEFEKALPQFFSFAIHLFIQISSSLVFYQKPLVIFSLLFHTCTNLSYSWYFLGSGRVSSDNVHIPQGVWVCERHLKKSNITTTLPRLFPLLQRDGNESHVWPVWQPHQHLRVQRLNWDVHWPCWGRGKYYEPVSYFMCCIFLLRKSAHVKSICPVHDYWWRVFKKVSGDMLYKMFLFLIETLTPVTHNSLS